LRQRLAAGSFTQTLTYLFKELTGETLKIQGYGKPLRLSYEFAMQTLVKWKAQCGLGTEPFSDVFMVGDNPKADVRGANSAGLLCSRCFVMCMPPHRQ
jgi:ribonucleotide monophosphatase NagD (HAD superfamily)